MLRNLTLAFECRMHVRRSNIFILFIVIYSIYCYLAESKIYKNAFIQVDWKYIVVVHPKRMATAVDRKFGYNF